MVKKIISATGSSKIIFKLFCDKPERVPEPPVSVICAVCGAVDARVEIKVVGLRENMHLCLRANKGARCVIGIHKVVQYSGLEWRRGRKARGRVS